jgi:GT2 family glycosyltransferase
MITQARSGGGNVVNGGAASLIVRRTAALGDSLAGTVVADRLIDLGFDVDYQSHADCHCMLRLHPRLGSVHVPSGSAHVDLDGAYEQHPNRKSLHYHQMFFERAQQQLKRFGIMIGQPTNCRPRLSMPWNRREAAAARLSSHPRPWIMIVPRSDSFIPRTIPDGVWKEIELSLKGTVFWLGRHPAPENIVDLNTRHFDSVLDYLSVADLLLCAETGPMHVAAAFGVPCVVIVQATDPSYTLNDQNDFITVSADLDCLHCQRTKCPKNEYQPPCQQVDPGQVADLVNSRLNTGVSAVVAVYQPDPGTLNRCLECVLPQVDEIVVTAEGNSVIPRGALRNEKIRYVQTTKRRIGYGRNANFGARHAHGKLLLLLNDDVFLDPDAVTRMKEEMKPGVGAVAHFLRYPSGQVYYCGKVRSPGARGWGHVSHRKWHPEITTVYDAENLCGASVLIRREAFYRVGGFDEDYFLYAEDDDLMLRLRKNGWKLTYTPHATGVHVEGQSTQKLGQPNELVSQANRVFDSKWRNYFDWNLNRCPMGNFDYV